MEFVGELYYNFTMPRAARIVKPDLPYHVTQRGNFRQNVFEEQEDFLFYKKYLKEYSVKYYLEILAYCFMSNHVHFICIPKDTSSMADTFKYLNMIYSQYYNNKMKQKGHLWQGRFYSCPLDESHLHAAIKYVENNPVRAGIVKNAIDYKWSSAMEHIKDEYDIVSGNSKDFIGIKNWKKYLGEEEIEEDLQKIRNHTMKGLPLGGEAFVSRLEKLFKANLKIKTRGRPKKEKKA